MKRHSQRGVALVIDLDFVSGDHYIAVTFLIVIAAMKARKSTRINHSKPTPSLPLKPPSSRREDLHPRPDARQRQRLPRHPDRLHESGVTTLRTTAASNLTDVSYYYDNAGSASLPAAQMQAMLEQSAHPAACVPVFIVTNKNFL